MCCLARARQVDGSVNCDHRLVEEGKMGKHVVSFKENKRAESQRLGKLVLAFIGLAYVACDFARWFTADPTVKQKLFYGEVLVLFSAVVGCLVIRCS